MEAHHESGHGPETPQSGGSVRDLLHGESAALCTTNTALKQKRELEMGHCVGFLCRQLQNQQPAHTAFNRQTVKSVLSPTRPE